MNFVINEKKYAEEILGGEGLGENRGYTVGVLARYYKADGYDDREIGAALNQIIKQRLPDTPDNIRSSWVKRAVGAAGKCELYDKDGFSVTRAEMDFVETAKSEKMTDRRIRRLMFTLLCFAKFEVVRGKEPWINTPLRDIFKSAGISGVTNSQRNLCLHELNKQGLVEFNHKVDSISVRIPFEKISEGKETAVIVDDLDNAGDVYLEYCGREYIRCEKCGVRVLKINNRAKYCARCAAQAALERRRNSVKEK